MSTELGDERERQAGTTPERAGGGGDRSLRVWVTAGTVVYLVVAFGGYLVSGDLRSFPAAVGGLFVAVGIVWVLSVLRVASRRAAWRAAGAYGLIALVGYLLVLGNRHEWQSDFGNAWDDSFYFEIAKMAVQDWRTIHHSLFDYVVGAAYWVASCFRESPQLLDVVPVVWSLGAAAVALSGEVAERVAGKRIPEWLLLLAAVGNCALMDTVAHLYRDALMLLLAVTAILLALGRRYIEATAIAGVAGLVRGANGVLALLAVALLIAGQRRNRHVQSRAASIAVVVFACAAVLMAQTLLPRVAGNPFAHGDRVTNQPDSVSGMLEARTRMGLGGAGESFSGKTDTTQRLLLMGAVAAPVRPVVMLFSPTTLRPLDMSVRVVQMNASPRILHVTMWPRLLEWVTVLGWPILAPLLVFGVLRGLRSSKSAFALTLLYVLTVCAIAFISLQPRHRCAFIILSPTMALLGLAECHTATGRRWWRILGAGYCAVIAVAALVA